MKKTVKKKPGPVPDNLVLGGNWRDNMKKALSKKKPSEGWPKPESKRKKKTD